MKIEVFPLNRFPELSPILAFWSFREWYIQRNIPFKTVLKAFQSRAHNSTLPCSFVATLDTMPVGMVSLKNDDLWTRKDLNPWLTSLFVLPEFRKRGIANMLIKSVIENATQLAVEAVFLFLGQSDKAGLYTYYTSRGWRYNDDALDNEGLATKILRYELQR